MVDLTIDERSVRVPEGTTVFDAARMNGIAIPTLCHLQNETPVGVCRLCVVDTGARVLAASCVRPVEPGMKVSTDSEKIRSARKTLLELLMADHPSPCARQRNSADCELETLARAAGVTQSGRQTMGVRLMNLASGDSVVALARNAEAAASDEADEDGGDVSSGEVPGAGGEDAE